MAAPEAAGREAGDHEGGEPAGPPDGDAGAGRRIGRYELIEQIGQGGAGTVWLAEQREPVQRRVALKVIKHGMDTSQVIARFEAERQALALMDHRHIARVLDGGETPGGRPFFVMEHVQGAPVHVFCAEHRLGIRRRLQLFAQICRAVQHAHQKGVIHRDIKPSNVLVSAGDGAPQPKIIDFGIAKAIHQPLTAKTPLTQSPLLLGTPEYMAPEQADMANPDIDTRADVYSLGVLMYELLTGTVPFRAQPLLEKGYTELVRVIREVDPPRPSTRMAALNANRTAIPPRCPAPPRQLRKLLTGDLDCIVMKALEKDRTRRYEAASTLAEDVERYLANEPVRARPPGLGYRLRKYVARHAVGVAATALVFGSLVAGTAIAWRGWDEAEAQARIARGAETDARAQATKAKTVSSLLDEMLSSANPRNAKGTNYTVRQLLDDFAAELGRRPLDDPEVEASVRYTVGKAYRGLGLLDEAEPHLRAAVTLNNRLFGDAHLATAQAYDALASLRLLQGDHRETERFARMAIAIQERSPEGDGYFTSAWNNVASAIHATGAHARAEKIFRQVLAVERASDNGDLGVAKTLNNLGSTLHRQARFEEAEQVLREAVEIHRRELGNDHPDLAPSLSNLGVVLMERNSFEEGEAMLLESLAIKRRTLGSEHLEVASTLKYLAEFYKRRSEVAEAERLSREALAMLEKLLRPGHPKIARTKLAVAELLRIRSAFVEAEHLLREALESNRQSFGQEHQQIAEVLLALGSLLGQMGKPREAEECLRESLAMARKLLGPEHTLIATILNSLAAVIKPTGAYREAEDLVREALALQRNLLGEEHSQVAQTLHNPGLHPARQRKGGRGRAVHPPGSRDATQDPGRPIARGRENTGRAVLPPSHPIRLEGGNRRAAGSVGHPAQAVRRRARRGRKEPREQGPRVPRQGRPLQGGRTVPARSGHAPQAVRQRARARGCSSAQPGSDSSPQTRVLGLGEDVPRSPGDEGEAALRRSLQRDPGHG